MVTRFLSVTFLQLQNAVQQHSDDRCCVQHYSSWLAWIGCALLQTHFLLWQQYPACHTCGNRRLFQCMPLSTPAVDDLLMTWFKWTNTPLGDDKQSHILGHWSCSLLQMLLIDMGHSKWWHFGSALPIDSPSSDSHKSVHVWAWKPCT